MSEASSSNPDPFSVTQQLIVSDWGPRNTSAQNISFDVMALRPTFDLGLMQSEGTHCSVFGQIPRLSCLSNGSFLEAISSSADSGGQGFENHDGSTNLLPSTDDQKAVMEELNPKKRKSQHDSDNLDSFPSLRKFKKIKCTEQKNLSPECLEGIIVNKDVQTKTPAVISAKQKLKQAEVREDYVHVRAKRGQATNSHSLAERVRREKINERMGFLQNLIPGCSKITGKAVMLGEIINYVQSLQNQVEFLSMKLATAIHPELNFDTKQIFHSGFGNSSAVMCDTAMNTFNPHLDGLFIPQSVMEAAIAVDREPINPPLLLKTALPHTSQLLPQAQRSWEDDDEFQPLFETCFSPNMNVNSKELPGIYEDEAI